MQFSGLFIKLGQGAVYAAITFGFMYLAKRIADKRTTAIDDDHEIQEKSNISIGFRRTGLYLAYAFAFAGSLSGSGISFMKDVYFFLIDGVVITVCLFFCRTINDRVMLAHINNDEEALKGNMAVGIAELGMYLATGFILNGAMTGISANYYFGLASTVVFFIIGQAALLICGLVYELITPYNIRDEIQRGNTAAGIALAGLLVALGIILRASVAGPATDWVSDIISFAVYAVYGGILLLILKKAMDWLFLPDTDLTVEIERDQNAAALIITQAVLIAGAIVVSAIM